MSKPAKPAAAKKEEAVADAPKNNKKLIIIIAVLVLVIAGGAGWYFMKGKNAGQAEEHKVEAPKEPKFIPLEAFTVNLQREEADQFLQVSITLKVLEPEVEEKIKAVLPEIRSKLNLLLSGKRPSELATTEGKKKLAEEIATETNGVLGIHNAPAVHAPAPAAVSEVAAAPAEHEKPAEGAAPAETPASAEGTSAPSAEGAPVAEGAPAHAAPAAGTEKKGVVDVLFTSFIIQ
ncbi:MAG: flagellar basal body-associated protein FliL [Gallionellaceae bacterium]|nr:MAG: flagellar basal body-associated protein FliL [Gallionellaceae bacterium]